MSETEVERADKPINCNNKHIQTMVLIIRPEEEPYTEVTPLHLLWWLKVWTPLWRPAALFISQGL